MVTTVISIISLIISAIGLPIAFMQIYNLKQQVKIQKENQRTDSLKVVLEIETQITAMKMEFDKTSRQIREKEDILSDNQREVLSEFFDTAKENYFNALDRLCFCFEKNYVDEKDWRVEYRNVLKDTIDTYPDDFNEASPYRHIKNINRKWQEES